MLSGQEEDEVQAHGYPGCRGSQPAGCLTSALVYTCGPIECLRVLTAHAHSTHACIACSLLTRSEPAGYLTSATVYTHLVF